jgi:hypothetical protein
MVTAFTECSANAVALRQPHLGNGCAGTFWSTVRANWQQHTVAALPITESVARI